MRCYFDGSDAKDENGNRWITLAGYAANDRLWGSFQQRWEEMLRSRYPIAPFIHMTDLLTFNDPFERLVGWNDEKVSSLVIDALKILQDLDKNKFCSFLCAVDVSARDRLVAQGYRISDPVSICAQCCVGKTLEWYVENHSNDLEPIHIFFDRGEPYLGPIRQLQGKYGASMGQIALDFWGLVYKPQAVNMRDKPAIQAADMLAWGHSRQLSEEVRSFRDLYKIMHEIIPSWTVTIDEKVMREKNPKSD